MYFFLFFFFFWRASYSAFTSTPLIRGDKCLAPRLRGPLTWLVWPHSVTESNQQTRRWNSVPTFTNSAISHRNPEFLIFLKGGSQHHCILPQRHSAGAELPWTPGGVGCGLLVCHHPHCSLLSFQPCAEHRALSFPRYALRIFSVSYLSSRPRDPNHIFRPEIWQLRARLIIILIFLVYWLRSHCSIIISYKNHLQHLCKTLKRFKATEWKQYISTCS